MDTTTKEISYTLDYSKTFEETNEDLLIYSLDFMKKEKIDMYKNDLNHPINIILKNYVNEENLVSIISDYLGQLDITETATKSLLTTYEFKYEKTKQQYDSLLVFYNIFKDDVLKIQIKKILTYKIQLLKRVQEGLKYIKENF